MKRKLWRVFCVICVCIGYSVVKTGADPVAPVYVPSGPQAAPLTAAEDIDGDVSLPTVTVRGFLNFRTTVDGTVIVFTPASESPQEPTPASAAPLATTSAPRLTSTSSAEAVADSIQHLSFTKHPGGGGTLREVSTELENEANTDDDRQSFRHLKQGLGTSGEINSSEQRSRSRDNGVSSSRAEAAAPSKTSYGTTPTLPQYPTGLVTVLGGTHVEGGATTVYETKVIGTYIEGKYAQILQSTSQIIYPASKSPEGTATPEHIPSSTRPRPNAETSTLVSSRPTPSKPEVVASRFRPTPGTTTKSSRPTPPNRQANRRRDDSLNANTVLQSSFKLPEGNPERASVPTQSLEKSYTRSSYTLSRRFRPSTTTSTDVPEDENTVSESQNTRRLPPRFRYVLPRRSTQTVRLNRFKVKLTVRNDQGDATELVTPQESGYDPQDDLLQDYDPLSPVDPARVVYQRTTITSEVTLHVGRRKSVRTLTITTSVPRTRHASGYISNALNDAQDVIPAQNNALFATSLPDGEEIPQVVVTRTFTTTERMLKTSLVPIQDGDETSYHTVTESFFILKIITAYKTMPPGEATLFNSGKDGEPVSALSFDSFTTGLLDGAVPLPPSPQQQLLQTPVPNGLLQASGSGREQAFVPLDHAGTLPLDLSHPLISLGAALQQNPLAAVYLGLQQLNRQVTLYSTITKTSTYIATDTIYSTKVVSFYDGRRTRSRTLSESLSTTEKTVTSYTTTVEPYLNTQMFQQQQQLQQLIGTQLPGGAAPHLPPPPPQFSTVTSTYTTVTTATSLSTRIYTLIYNAISTKFRTVTSTTLYETTITTTTTSEVPLAVTAPPSGVFPFLG